jgi:hypothetical protein
MPGRAVPLRSRFTSVTRAREMATSRLAEIDRVTRAFMERRGAEAPT